MSPHRDKPPKELPDDARQWWGVLVDELEARGALDKVTTHRLSIYCQLFAQYHRVTEFINREGQVLTIRDDKGEVKSSIVAPEAVQQERLVKILQRFDKEFGFLEGIKSADPIEELRKKLALRAGVAERPAGHN